ncbi:MAG: isoprenylcysteine carboxylmethyltransferase family protein [Bacteroidota bacterium]
MKKLIPVGIIMVLSYLIPLFIRPDLLVYTRLHIVMLAGLVLLFFQPPLRLEDMERNQKTDKFSVLAILLGVILSQNIVLFDWAFLQDPPQLEFNWSGWTIGGLILLVGGMVIRLAAIRQLGRYFTATVETQNSQQIVSDGLYGIVRHPSYLGAYLSMLGAALMFSSWMGLIATAVIQILAYAYRINMEEETLLSDLGDAYERYAIRTKRMIPFVW